MGRNETIREQRRRRKEFIFRVRGVMVAVVLGIFLGILSTVIFTVKNVEVEGNTLYGSQLISDAVLNDDYSWNTLYVYLKYRFLDTEDIPFVDTMEISITGPHSLHITVYEKGIMGYLYINGIGENAYFDKDGFVVETSSQVIEGVPKIIGLDCDEVVLYEKLPLESTTLRGILTLTQTLKRADLIPDTITYGVTNDPVLAYGDIEVTIGSTSDLTQKVARLAEILPTLGNSSGTLHMENWTEENTSIVFDSDEISTGEETTEETTEEETTEASE